MMNKIDEEKDKLESSNPSLNHSCVENSFNDGNWRTTNQPKCSRGNDGSSSTEKGKGKILACLQKREQMLKKVCTNSSTHSSSSSSLESNSQRTSAEDVSQGDKYLAASNTHDYLARSNDSEQAENAIFSTEFTSEYTSSSTASDGASGGEIRCNIYHVMEEKTNTRFIPSYFKHNPDDTLSKTRDSCSTSYIDEIIRRAKNALKSTAYSSSSSDDFSFFGEIENERGHQVAKQTAENGPQTKNGGNNDSSSVGNSSKSSDSFTGLASLGTACLEGIASDITVGDGGFSSGSSGLEYASQGADCSSSGRLERLDKSFSVDRNDQNEKSSREGYSSIEFESSSDQFADRVHKYERFSRNTISLRQTPSTSQNTALKNVVKIDSKPIDIPSVLNTSHYRHEEVSHMLPVHLHHSLLARMDKVLTNSHDSLQMLKAWDKGMGLKSTHSKTMTQSARSRKKLHTKIKRMIKMLNALEKK
ncbi:hypothetical protein ACHAXS_005004 [Conticribra weissflogii]